MEPRRVCAQTRGEGSKKTNTKEYFMRGKRSKGSMVLHIYACAYVYEPQHKTDGWERVREEQILRNKGEWDKARATGKISGSLWSVEDKVTK